MADKMFKRELGLAVENNIIRDIYLIDETNEHYIVSKEQVPGHEGSNETFKLEKSLVKVIMHKPDHMRKLTGGTRAKDKQRG